MYKRQVLPQPVVILARLEETGQHEAGVELAADVVFQRVAELVGRVGAVELRPLLLADVAGVGVGQAVLQLQNALRVGQVAVEGVLDGVDCCLLYTSRCV